MTVKLVGRGWLLIALMVSAPLLFIFNPQIYANTIFSPRPLEVRLVSGSQ